MEQETTITLTTDRAAAAWLDAMQRLCGVTPKGRYGERGDARAMVTHATIASLNAALSTTLDPDVESLDEMAAEVGRFGLPWSIIVRGEASDAVAGLAASHGLTRHGAMPFMTCTVGDAVLGAVEERRTPIRAVGSTESDRYTDALVAGFGVPAGAFGSLMGGRVLDTPAFTGYLAEVSGRPVATGLGLQGADAVGVFNISVVPSARSRGLGRAMTARAMADGFAAGADIAYLHASTAGQPLYESMGFRLAETWTTFTAP
ncbi:GNAT family N-acetyltransferase [Dactylosporangium sp. NPDC005572]|uniref:GNAT family N-acetyltransferase n=1 Tax=Dactylosporangium sp. NPDC005572 TaxID=3156889 RepID=UPI0033AA14A6